MGANALPTVLGLATGVVVLAAVAEANVSEFRDASDVRNRFADDVQLARATGDGESIRSVGATSAVISDRDKQKQSKKKKRKQKNKKRKKNKPRSPMQ